MPILSSAVFWRVSNRLAASRLSMPLQGRQRREVLSLAHATFHHRSSDWCLISERHETDAPRHGLSRLFEAAQGRLRSTLERIRNLVVRH